MRSTENIWIAGLLMIKHSKRNSYVSSIWLQMILIFFSAGCGKKPEQTKPLVTEITESVYASARIRAKDQYTVFPLQGGTLKEILVQAGDSVSENQPLFRLDDLAQGLSSENARLALELSEENAQSNSAKFRELEAALILAKEKMALEGDLLARQKALWAQGVGTRSELDQRQLALENARSSVLSAQSRLDQLKAQLKNDLARARNSFKISKKQNQDFLIRSVLKGRVFDVLKKEGELVGPQTALAVVGDPSMFIIEMEVDQADIIRIVEGQKVSLVLDSYKGQVFEASVSKIYPIMDEKSRTFKIEARFINAPPTLFPNLTAEANILVSSKKNALTIPVSYLVDGKFVWVSEDEKREVSIGLEDDQKVEVLKGLDASTIIFKP